MKKQQILILATGGTFDKVYYDALSDYHIGDPQIEWIIEQANLDMDMDILTVIRKDSLDIDDIDRDNIYAEIIKHPAKLIVITHGTDTMVETAKYLQKIPEKTTVLTGAMQPARFRDSDAVFNTGFALAAVQLLPAGVYIAMNGRILDPDKTQKRRSTGQFQESTSE